jgi:hypothetical protein
MLLPLLPVLLVSLGKVMDRRGVRILIWASLAVSAAQLCHPMLRFNYADGTDGLISMLAGPASAVSTWLPSAVRFNLAAFAIWTFISGFIVWQIARNSRTAPLSLAASFGLICLLGGMPRTTWEAEDLPPRMMDYCSLYPADNEPESRAYWLFSRERMLLLSGDADRVRIPVDASPGDTVTVEVSFRDCGGGDLPGLRVSCGDWSDSIFAVSDVMEAPSWMTLIRDMRLDGRPENLEELSWRLEVPALSDTLVLSPVAGPRSGSSRYGIYLDKVSFE